MTKKNNKLTDHIDSYEISKLWDDDQTAKLFLSMIKKNINDLNSKLHELGKDDCPGIEDNLTYLEHAFLRLDQYFSGHHHFEDKDVIIYKTFISSQMSELKVMLEEIDNEMN